MKSEMGVRHDHDRFSLTTDQIVHHSTMNTPNQMTKFIRIITIVKKTLNIPLPDQWLKFLENIF